ncbi:MAG TPA: DUF6789 family protein [Thermomicrobiales bacterium]|nr:DUF6789 family protein [Thermomicrobiales bacterium]
MAQVSWSRIVAGMLAGLAGGAAFAAVMELDMALSRRRVDDFQLLAGFGPTRDKWRVVGPLVHSINSVSLGGLYGVVAQFIPGTGWRKGLTFALAENTLLWPIIIVLDRVHPAIRSGELPVYNRPWPFLVENLRHATFGIVLGTVYERLTQR